MKARIMGGSMGITAWIAVFTRAANVSASVFISALSPLTTCGNRNSGGDGGRGGCVGLGGFWLLGGAGCLVDFAA